MEQQVTYFGSSARYRIFTTVKYIVYALLCLNIYLFLQEELLALEYTFTDGVEPGQLIQAFSATIDTAAWVVLLLMFELETSVLDDKKLHGAVRWLLHGLRFICYLAIFYSLEGYYAELVTLYDVTSMPGASMCAFVDGNYSLLLDLDDYAPLDAVNCAAAGPEIYRIAGFDILADADTLRAAQWLAWVDVINAFAWVLVVVVLEVEVRLQLRGSLSNRIMQANKVLKIVVYATLFVAAAYWGVAGDFLDFWDAVLWLFAFVFIELNVFEWQYETHHPAAAPA